MHPTTAVTRIGETRPADRLQEGEGGDDGEHACHHQHQEHEGLQEEPPREVHDPGPERFGILPVDVLLRESIHGGAGDRP